MTRSRILPFFAGLVLTLSGMMSPEKMLGFVDVAGEWDPSLAFVHARAVGISALSYRLKAPMAQPLLAPRFEVPTNLKPDARLVGGTALFDISWGLAGFCPGPGNSSPVLGLPQFILFVAAVLLGILLHRFTGGRGPVSRKA
ncbi:hypothetical protein ASF56_02575 [Methylobacterium sp. Leaf122]|uniref:YeeE/YedE family protein n=2 Tax=Methylorubrum extorquens TaxID=408 RepID=A0AAX3WLM7_METEX|nr:DUF6691 family protein [Methylobacterium sp. Leaf122]KQQ24788.1 hypothetical protein ASF56_02575 [Methylobacterium sp. Leaf122]WHQ71470.1 YeeE/YedE family protein [Methylorubrum extorquens]